VLFRSLRTRPHGDAQLQQVMVTPPEPVKEVTPSDPKTPEQKMESPEEVVAVHKHRPRPSVPVLSKREREEGLMAKEQVMVALRLTTEKLSLVHKKNTNPANQIKNQHRVG